MSQDPSAPYAASGELAGRTDLTELPDDAGPRYVERGLLGRGGMGEVFSARDGRLGRDVAYKVVRANGASGEARLLREARLTAVLEHPGIVPVYDAGRDEQGRLYFTMRIVRGRTLAAAFAETPPPRIDGPLLRHFLDACHAVAFAHSLGVVHRDLKPSNILVGAFGETQVADWGLATRVGSLTLPGATAAPDEPGLTQDGAVVGTPAYMSPEQARGEPATPQSDVWALGAVLYELLGGSPPLGRGSSAEHPPNGTRRPIPPLKGIPNDLAALVERALHANPAERYGTAESLADDMARWLDGRRISAYAYTSWELAARAIRAWRAPLTVAALATLLLVGGAGYAWQRTAAERDRALDAEREAVVARNAADRAYAGALVQQAQRALFDGDRAASERLAARSAALVPSADAEGVLAAWASFPRPQLLTTRSLPTCDQGALAANATDTLCWTSDQLVRDAEDRPERLGGPIRGATWLAGELGWVVGRRGGLEWRRPDGTLQASVPTEHSIGLSAHPEAPQVITLHRNRLVAHDLVAGTSVEQDVCPTTAHAAYHPDGRLGVLCESGDIHLGAPGDFAWHGQVESGHVASMHFATDGQLLLGTLDGEVVWLEKGREIQRQKATDSAVIHMHAVGDRVAATDVRGGVSILSKREPMVRLPQGTAREARLVPEGIVTRSRDRQARWSLPEVDASVRVGPEGVSAVAMSADGRLGAAAHGDGSLVLFTIDDGRAQTVAWQPRVLKDVAFSPDGTQVAATAVGHDAIVLVDTATGEPTAALPMPRNTSRLVWLASDLILAATYDAFFHRWTLDGSDPVAVAVPPIADLEVTPDASRAILLGRDGSVWWTDGVQVTPVAVHPGATAAAGTNDGRMVVAVGGDVQVLAPDGQPTATLSGDGTAILDVQVDPDGRRVVAGTLDGTVLVWDITSGLRLARLVGHRDRVASLAIGPGGQLLTGSWDHTRRLARLPTSPTNAQARLEAIERSWGPAE